jgi:hypothetical protein
MKRLATGFPLAALLAVASLAQTPAQPPGPTVEQVVAVWTNRLETEYALLLAARARLRDAETALGDARQRRSPRGTKLAALREEELRAAEELSQREAAWPELLEEARRASVPPAVLREYEEPAAAPVE